MTSQIPLFYCTYLILNFEMKAQNELNNQAGDPVYNKDTSLMMFEHLSWPSNSYREDLATTTDQESPMAKLETRTNLDSGVG